MPKASISPPVQAMNSAPSYGPMPGMLRTTSAWRCSRNRAAIRASMSAISSSRARTVRARVFTTVAAVLSPATAVCWARAAATATSATAWAPWTLRFFSQVASRADPAQASRLFASGHQHEGTLGGGVVEGPFQGGKVFQELCPHSVDGAGAIGCEVVAAGGEDLQIHRDLVPFLQGLQVLAHPCLVGYDVGILRIGLAVASVTTGGVVDGPARDIAEPLAVVGQESDQ